MANVPKSLRLGRVMLIVRMVATLVVIAPQWAAATGSHPVLELETGGHMATVRELIITPDSKFLISGGDDKTIRIIDLANGQTVRILRGASGEGDHGKILAMALSPDGETLAVGGQLRRAGSGAEPIRLLDLATGAVKTLLEGHKDQVLSLAFSADGATLLSGSVDDTAILWSLADSRPMLRLTGHGGDVNAAAFTREGARIVTGTGSVIESGVIVVRDGLIEAVGGDGLEIPFDAQVIDGKGLVAYPGFVDAGNDAGIDAELEKKRKENPPGGYADAAKDVVPDMPRENRRGVFADVESLTRDRPRPGPRDGRAP